MNLHKLPEREKFLHEFDTIDARKCEFDRQVNFYSALLSVSLIMHEFSCDCIFFMLNHGTETT